MKSLLALYLIASLAMLANAAPNKLNAPTTDILDIFVHDENDFLEIYINCLYGRSDSILDRHADVKGWFEGFFYTIVELRESRKKCDEILGMERENCISNVKLAQTNQTTSLITTFPKEKIYVLYDLWDVLWACMGF